MNCFQTSSNYQQLLMINPYWFWVEKARGQGHKSRLFTICFCIKNVSISIKNLIWTNIFPNFTVSLKFIGFEKISSQGHRLQLNQYTFQDDNSSVNQHHSKIPLLMSLKVKCPRALSVFFAKVFDDNPNLINKLISNIMNAWLIRN